MGKECGHVSRLEQPAITSQVIADYFTSEKFNSMNRESNLLPSVASEDGCTTTLE